MTLCLLQNRHSVIYLTERKVRIMGKHCQKPINPSEKSELRFVSSQSAHALSAFKERFPAAKGLAALPPITLFHRRIYKKGKCYALRVSCLERF